MAKVICDKKDLGEPHADLLNTFQEKVPYPNAKELFNGDQGPEYITNYAMNYQFVKPGELSKDELIDLVWTILKPEGIEEYEIDLKVQMLRNAVIDPNITDYIFYDDMTPEQVINKALAYKPIDL